MTYAAVHPFPARMAPDVAEAAVASLPPGSVVLDPMMGSGTFPIAAARSGSIGIGLDTDPLAVVIARTALGNFDLERYARESNSILEMAADLDPWMADDEETREFVEYWFDPEAREKLGKLAAAIRRSEPSLRPMMWCALSRTIVTKDVGTSRARDVSHSRPHRVRDKGLDPYNSFRAAIRTIVRRIPSDERTVNASLSEGDARWLPLPDKSVDAVMTSPPYLSAIDYLRGHRLSLVWMGYSVQKLRALRGTNIGTERGTDKVKAVPGVRPIDLARLSSRAVRQLSRYAGDMAAVLIEMRRVLRPSGTLLLVVGNATLEGVQISLPTVVSGVAATSGFELIEQRRRPIESRRRYLPPPGSTKSPLAGRLREEVILQYQPR